MKKLGDLAQPNAHLQQNEESPRQIDNRIIARIWTKMAEVYGYKWTSQYGEVTNDQGALSSAAVTWAQGLSVLGDQTEQMKQISDGFAKMVEGGYDWPPSLPQFLDLCRKKRLAPYHRIYKNVLPAPVDHENARIHLQKAREILNGKH